MNNLDYSLMKRDILNEQLINPCGDFSKETIQDIVI